MFEEHITRTFGCGLHNAHSQISIKRKPKRIKEQKENWKYEDHKWVPIEDQQPL